MLCISPFRPAVAGPWMVREWSDRITGVGTSEGFPVDAVLRPPCANPPRKAFGAKARCRTDA